MSISWPRWRAFAVVAAGALLLGGLTGPAQAANSAAVGLDSWRSVRLAIELKRAISQQNFKDLLDTAPPGSAAGCAARHRGDQGYEPTTAQTLRKAGTLAALAATAETIQPDAERGRHGDRVGHRRPRAVGRGRAAEPAVPER